MKGIRSALSIALMVLIGVPLSAQQSTLRLPPEARAEKGDEVIVTLRDGREVRGKVGRWVDDDGFCVKPADGVTWLIRPEDVVSLRNAASGRPMGMPPQKTPSKMSTANAVTLGVFATLGGLLLFLHFVPRT